MKIKTVDRNGRDLGVLTINEARKIIATGHGTYYMSDGKYILMIWTK